MLADSAIERGVTRWAAFSRSATKLNKNALQARVLDVGCGRGEFVLAGLNDGVDVYGIDVHSGGIEKFRASGLAPNGGISCVAYDGEVFPFPSQHFRAVHSWFVFEHIPRPHHILAEINRVAAAGCVLVLNAQDGRTLFEGHAKIPWLPHLPRPLKQAWLEETTTQERRDYILSSVFETTGEEVRAVLQMFGWKIETFDVDGYPNALPLLYPCDLEETRKTAREAMRLFEAGKWPQQPTNYRVRAKKK